MQSLYVKKFNKKFVPLKTVQVNDTGIMVSCVLNVYESID